VEPSPRNKILWTSQEIAFATQGQVSGDFSVTGVSIDTRTLEPGDLFIALKGPKADGHDHIESAMKAGAAGVLTEKPLADVPSIVVKDTMVALQDLGAYSRARAQGKIVGITGSFGKTGSKEALKFLLSKQAPTSGTISSFNNHWGVPLTLARLYADDAYGVFELGMNHAGELTDLSKQVKPHLAVITTLGETHIGNFSGLDAIAAAKAEIFEGVVAGGSVLLNRDNAFYTYFESMALKKRLNVSSFGRDAHADYRTEAIREVEGGYAFDLVTPKTKVSCHINLLGSHWVTNAACVLAAMDLLGADIVQGAQDFKEFILPQGRGVISQIPFKNGQITIIDESYNAAPSSMKMALKTLGRYTPEISGRRVAILGDMLELGDQSIAYHQDLHHDIVENKVDVVFACGQDITSLKSVLPESVTYVQGREPEEMFQDIDAVIQPGDVLMIKGSRGQRAYRGRMYKFIDYLETLARQKN